MTKRQKKRQSWFHGTGISPSGLSVTYSDTEGFALVGPVVPMWTDKPSPARMRLTWDDVIWFLRVGEFHGKLRVEKAKP